MKIKYLEILTMAERLHRQFLGVIQLELDHCGIRDVNNVQALIAYNIGDAEMTVSELMWRGCYLGSNVSYNVKKLTEAGYLLQERSPYDRRVMIVRLSQKGLDLFAIVKKMNDRRVEALSEDVLKNDELVDCLKTLQKIQNFLGRNINLRDDKIAV